jgi:hypothetical protein
MEEKMARKPISIPRYQEKPKGVWEKEYNSDADKEVYAMDLGQGIRICVMNNHIDYKGKWVSRISPFQEWPRELKVDTADEAKAKALEAAKTIIEPIYKLLQAAE